MLERRAILIEGIVQGVGFRPFVYLIASNRGLAGFVRNEMGRVLVEIEGDQGDIQQFMHELTIRAPSLARIERVSFENRPPLGESGFRIEASVANESSSVLICPDIATCVDCLHELFDPADRRYRYPFINCTNCGPRLTIIQGSPYDRSRTTMRAFRMCDACRHEYDEPLDRRFHAQPVACAMCGPRLGCLNAHGHPVVKAEPLAEVLAAVKAGKIAAIKGLGGYHLACDAGNGAAVAELRRRKHRDEKPFAVMLPNVAAALASCYASSDEIQLLTSSQRPIVLLRKRDRLGLAEEVAPGNAWLGVMLPYTPVHHLLMHDLAGTALVMTSGNRSNEPIVYDDAEVFRRLGGIADLILTHDRPIHVRCDDSVTRLVNGLELPIRRSRGYTPMPLTLPLECPVPLLAVGGQMKNTFALGCDRHAILSHHIGDLDDLRALAAFERDIDLFEELFAIEPRRIVHDLHPDYASTRYALRRQEQSDIRALAVQHHHAHMASCMAEHGLTEPAIGVCFDGTGFGTDGAIWGGEILVGDLRRFRRAAHLRYVPLPGADKAIREPWRMALAHLLDAGSESISLTRRVDVASMQTVRQMIERRFNTPLTSSAGRLFDAIASLIGIRDRVSFEGQAAMQLEDLAEGSCENGAYSFDFFTPAKSPADPAPMTIDTRPMIREVLDDLNRGVTPGMIARRFHTTIAHLIVETCQKLREQCGLNRIFLSGGVFMNGLLLRDTVRFLRERDFLPFHHRIIPPNDGGISFGQLAVAVAQPSTGTQAIP